MIPIELESHGVLVRPLEPPDEPAVQALFTACEDWFCAATGQPSESGDVQSMYYALPEGAQPSAKRMLVVTRGEQAVGIVDAVLHHPDESGCAVGVFLLHPAERRRGLGTALARGLLELLSDHQISTVTATAAPGFPPAQEFLRTLGFDVEGDHEESGAAPSAVNRDQGPAEPVPLRASLRLG